MTFDSVQNPILSPMSPSVPFSGAEAKIPAPKNSSGENFSDLARGELWRHISAELVKYEGRNNFESWFKHIQLMSVQGGKVTLSLPTGFMRDFLRDHFTDIIRRCFTEALGRQVEIEFSLKSAINGGESSGHHADSPKANNFADKHSKSPATPQATLVAFANETSAHQDSIHNPQNLFMPVALDARYTFENFITGKPNELAFAAARRVAESPSSVYNPLFLYGGVGLGKTHLMHAIAWEIARRTPQRRVIYLSAEKFMNQFVRAMRFKDTATFKEQFRSVDVLMVDDLQFFGGKDSTQEEFFHTFNALIDQNHQIVISADKSPSDLEDMEERLRSRLGCGLVADIHPTTYELRLSILMSKAEQLQVTLPKKCLNFSPIKLPRMCGNSKARSTASLPMPVWSGAPSRWNQPKKCCAICCAPMTAASRLRIFNDASPSITPFA